jgi:hypothetical protein
LQAAPEAGCAWPAAHAWLSGRLSQLQRSEISAYLERKDRRRDGCKSEQSFLRAFWDKERRDPERALACVSSFLLLERLRELLLRQLGENGDGGTGLGQVGRRQRDRKRFDALLGHARKRVSTGAGAGDTQQASHRDSAEYAEMVVEMALAMLAERRQRRREAREGQGDDDSGAGEAEGIGAGAATREGLSPERGVGSPDEWDMGGAGAARSVAAGVAASKKWF